jgi:transcriptional regulator with XRE-family HTH domain
MTGKELKEWRENHKMTQQQLAYLFGVFNVTVARWETGVRKIPSFLHLALLGLEKTKMKGGDKVVRKRPDTKEINKRWYSALNEKEKGEKIRREVVGNFLERLEQSGLLGVRSKGKFFCLNCFYESIPEVQFNKEDIIGPRDVKYGEDYFCSLCKKPLTGGRR